MSKDEHNLRTWGGGGGVLDKTAPRSAIIWDRGRLDRNVELHLCRYAVDAQFEETQDGGPQGMGRGAVLGPPRLWQPRKGDGGPEKIWEVSAQDGGGDEGVGGLCAHEEGRHEIGQQGEERSRVAGVREEGIDAPVKEEGEEGAQDGEVAGTDGGVAVEEELDTVEQVECAAGGGEAERGEGVVRDGRRLLGDVGIDAEDGGVGVVGGVEDVVRGVEQGGERHGHEIREIRENK